MSACGTVQGSVPIARDLDVAAIATVPQHRQHQYRKARRAELGGQLQIGELIYPAGAGDDEPQRTAAEGVPCLDLIVGLAGRTRQLESTGKCHNVTGKDCVARTSPRFSPG
jgi:hypothetical protein